MTRSTLAMAVFGLAALLHGTAAWAAFPTTVSYQGELRENGVPREGTVDLVFYVFDQAGTHVQTLIAPDTPLNRGLFTAELSFDAALASNAQQYELQIAVRDGASSGGFQSLEPRQPISSVPFALNASTLEGKHSADLAPRFQSSYTFSNVLLPSSASQPNTKLEDISMTAPANGTIVVRARGNCHLYPLASGEFEAISLGLGNDEADSGSLPVRKITGAYIYTQSELVVPFTAERSYTVMPNQFLQVGLYGKKEVGTEFATNCSGQLMAEFFPLLP